MKFIKIFLALAILLLSPNLFADEKNQGLEFDLPSKAGNVKLSDFKGKVVYLDFWASWCGPCKQSFPWMNAMHEKYQSHGLEIIGVNLDINSEEVQKFLATNNSKFTIVFDNKGQTPRMFGVKGMPSSFILNRDGKVIFQHMGFNDNEKDKLEQKLVEALRSK